LAQIQTFGQISASNTPLMWNGEVARAPCFPWVGVQLPQCFGLNEIHRILRQSQMEFGNLAFRKYAHWCATCHCSDPVQANGRSYIKKSIQSPLWPPTAWLLAGHEYH